MTLGGTQITSLTSGTTLRVSAVFTDLATGLAEDPTTVTAAYQLGDTAAVSTVYGSGPMVRDGRGLYHWDIDTTGFAGPGEVVLMIVYWTGVGDVDVTSDPVVVRVVGPPFAIP